jgi:hypothetical protein
MDKSHQFSFLHFVEHFCPILICVYSSTRLPEIMAEEDISDEQLHQLLKDAEQRLKNAKSHYSTAPSLQQR